MIDGPLAMAPCVSRLQFRKCDDCPDLATCSIREALLRARDATADVLEGYSLAEAAAGRRRRGVPRSAERASARRSETAARRGPRWIRLTMFSSLDRHQLDRDRQRAAP